MRQTFIRLAGVIFIFLPSLILANDSIFDQADHLRRAIISGDIEYIRSLDRDNELVVPDNISYLFETPWIKKFDQKKISVQEILRMPNVSTYIIRQAFDDKKIFYIYWAGYRSNEGVYLTESEWLRTLAACALERDEDGSWHFYKHLCFAETGGPFE